MSPRETRFARAQIAPILRKITEAVRPHVERVAWVGSWRRGMADLGDADLLLLPMEGQGEWATIPIRAALSVFDRTVYRGRSFLYGYVGKIGVNVFITTPDRWGAALQYTTGSREHNIALRAYAKARGLMANQEGVFNRRTHVKLPDSSETESGFYRSLGLRWVRPERRQRGNGQERNPGLFPLVPHPRVPSSSDPATGTAGAQGDGREALVSPEGGSQPADQRTTRRP